MSRWGSSVSQPDPNELPISAEIYHLVGAATSIIRKPNSASAIILQAEVGEWRVKVGDHAERTFVDGDVSVADDEITITGHEYQTGDGPLQLNQTVHYLDIGGETLTFDQVGAANDTITRSAGSFVTDGFTNGMVITISGTTSNDGTYTIAIAPTATVLEFAGDVLTDEGPVDADGIRIVQGDVPAGTALDTEYWVGVIDDDTIVLGASPGNVNRKALTAEIEIDDPEGEESDFIPVDITAAAGGGTHQLGNESVLVETAIDGRSDNGVLFQTTDGRMAITARAVTVVGFDAADALAYWFV